MAVTVFVLTCLLPTVLLLAVLVDVQQTGKVARIGLLDPSTASGSAILVDAFRQAISDGSSERISASITDSRMESASACPSLRRSWFV
ncbi:MAG: hypothetical protein HY695_04095 [Deltaproteobacteria bacterium]|nr:hypothetical protein [Deltaproteobacteria bacterium]